MNNPVTAPICAVCATFLVALLYIFKETHAGPLFGRMSGAFVSHAESNWLHYVIGACLIMGACFTAFYDNFAPLDKRTYAEYGWWQVLALVSKSLGAAPSALLAYLMRSPLTPKTESSLTPKPPEAKPPA